MINLMRRYEEAISTFGWLPPLAEGDAIATFVATVLSGSATVTIATDHDGTLAEYQISGGEDGEDVFLSLAVTTTNGEHHPETAFVAIRSSAAFDAVSPNELREYLRDVADSDEALADLITAAREHVEQVTGYFLIQHTRTHTVDQWQAMGRAVDDWWEGERQGPIGGVNAPRFVELPGWPVSSLTKVETFAGDGTPSEVPAATFYLASASRPAKLALQPGAVWPPLYRPVEAARITYVVGYASPAEIPAALKRAILQIAAHWYENRELVDLDGPTKVPMQAGRILSKFRDMRL